MTVTLEQVQNHLPELLAKLQPGEQADISKDGIVLATITRRKRTSWPCKAGSAKENAHWMATDFDAPLEDFQEYMG